MKAQPSDLFITCQENGIVLNLSTSVPKEKPVLKTITAYFPAAEAYEREVVDFWVPGRGSAGEQPLSVAGRLAGQSVSLSERIGNPKCSDKREVAENA